MLRVNLGGTGLEGFTNIDISPKADLVVDLEKERIPIEDNLVDVLISMNFIGYFTKDRAEFLIKDVHRILNKGGVCRFGTQDLRLISQKYLDYEKDYDCERLNRWFGNGEGYEANGKKCKYVYDFNTLEGLFKKAKFRCVPADYGFSPAYRFDMCGEDIAMWDNRPDQQFFIECIK